MKHQVDTLQLVTKYFDAIIWCLDCGLLPEKVSGSTEKCVPIYIVNILQYTEQRYRLTLKISLCYCPELNFTRCSLTLLFCFFVDVKSSRKWVWTINIFWSKMHHLLLWMQCWSKIQKGKNCKFNGSERVVVWPLDFILRLLCSHYWGFSYYLISRRISSTSSRYISYSTFVTIIGVVTYFIYISHYYCLQFYIFLETATTIEIFFQFLMIKIFCSCNWKEK